MVGETVPAGLPDLPMATPLLRGSLTQLGIIGLAVDARVPDLTAVVNLPISWPRPRSPVDGDRRWSATARAPIASGQTTPFEARWLELLAPCPVARTSGFKLLGACDRSSSLFAYLPLQTMRHRAWDLGDLGDLRDLRDLRRQPSASSRRR